MFMCPFVYMCLCLYACFYDRIWICVCLCVIVCCCVCRCMFITAYECEFRLYFFARVWIRLRMGVYLYYYTCAFCILVFFLCPYPYMSFSVCVIEYMFVIVCVCHCVCAIVCVIVLFQDPFYILRHFKKKHQED